MCNDGDFLLQEEEFPSLTTSLIKPIIADELNFGDSRSSVLGKLLILLFFRLCGKLGFLSELPFNDSMELFNDIDGEMSRLVGLSYGFLILVQDCKRNGFAVKRSGFFKRSSRDFLSSKSGK